MEYSLMDNKVYEKIQKLLRMAEHPNSNEHEAANALRMAQDLLFQNNLTRADIKTDDNQPSSPSGIGKLDITETVGYTWKSTLLGVIARNSLCNTVLSSHDNIIHVFGTYDNVKSVIEMYQWITNELEQIAIRQWTIYKNDGTGREHCRTWKTGFFLGAIHTINERLKENLDTFATGPGSAIVPYNKGLVSDAVKRVFPHLTTIRRSTRSYDGYNTGKMAGNNVRLRPQRKIGNVLALN